MERALLSVREAAKYLGISSRLLWQLTCPRGPIPCVRLGTGNPKYSRVLYSIEALDAWIREQLKGQAKGGAGGE